MDINGTVTLSLTDFENLKHLSAKGTRQLVLHKKLLARTSQFLTALVYDPDIPQEQAQVIIAKVRTLSNALPEINFYHDKANAKIILGLSEEAASE